MRLFERSIPVALAFAAFALSACSATYKNTVNFDPSEPLRVAVLPFAQVNSRGEFINEDGTLLLDNVPFVSSKGDESPTQYLQRLTQNDLEKSGLDIVSPTVVERKLSHSSLSKGASFDLMKVWNAKPSELCGLLVCDAVVYGKVTKWDRSYYGLQSVNTVGLDLKLVSAATGDVLFSSTAEDSDSRGLSKGPTGFSSLVIEPIRGLGSDIIRDLGANVVSKMLQPLYVRNRPEELSTPPPAIYASAHDGIGSRLTPQHPLTILVFGSPGLSGTFSVGKTIENIPMEERDRGHYIGEFYPLETDTLREEYVTVSLSDDHGRTTRQRIGRGPVSYPSN